MWSGRSPGAAEQLPPLLQPFGAVPPLITDIDLSVDDSTLYVSCWGTGELKRFDVSNPRAPRETATVKLGGIAGEAAGALATLDCSAAVGADGGVGRERSGEPADRFVADVAWCAAPEQADVAFRHAGGA